MKVQLLLIVTLSLALSSIVSLNSSNQQLQQGNIGAASGISIKNSSVTSAIVSAPVVQPVVQTVITEQEKYVFNDLKTFTQAALGEHNRLRAIHSAPKLRLSKSLSKSAQSWANYLANANMYSNLTQNKDFTKSNKENSEIYQNVLEKSLFPFSGAEMTDYWYKQGATFNFATFSPLNESENTEAFIQIIWKGTTEVGFGRAYGKNGYYGVAYYRSSSKVADQYPINISPPVSIQINMVISQFTGRLFNIPVTNTQVSNAPVISQTVVPQNTVILPKAKKSQPKRSYPSQFYENKTPAAGQPATPSTTAVAVSPNTPVTSNVAIVPNPQQQYYNENLTKNNQMYPQQAAANQLR